jgi:5S rRNA maturation endonuclease (ribonuclease M5)
MYLTYINSALMSTKCLIRRQLNNQYYIGMFLHVNIVAKIITGPRGIMNFRAGSVASPEDMERAGRLREVLDNLTEVNASVPIIVEGKRDVSALRKLGVDGEIITLHRGINLYEFCADISQRFQKVILLLDWDEKGTHLTDTVSSHLRGHCEEFSNFRAILRLLCQKEIRDIEGLPKLLKRLEGDENTGE